MAPDFAVLAMLQSMIGGISKEEAFELYELTRRVILNGVTISPTGVIAFGPMIASSLINGKILALTLRVTSVPLGAVIVGAQPGMIVSPGSVVTLANTVDIGWRNAADTGNASGITLETDDSLVIGSTDGTARRLTFFMPGLASRAGAQFPQSAYFQFNRFPQPAGTAAGLRFETETYTSLFQLDPQQLSGTGGVGFGTSPNVNAFVIVDPPAITVPTNTVFYRAWFSSGGTLTVPTATTSTNISTVTISKPNVVLSGTGAATNVYNLILQAADSVGTNTGSLWAIGAVRCDSSVGVGTATPEALVTIRGTNKGTDSFGNLFVSTSDVQAINKGGQIVLGGASTDSGTPINYFGAVAGRKENGVTGSVFGYVSIATANAGTLVERMRVDSGGNVTIGVATATAQLHTTGTVRFATFGAGTATFDANGNVSSVSDERLKTNIRPLPYGLTEVLQLQPILFKYNALSQLDTKEDYAGFSAQAVERIMPVAVGATGNDHYKSLSDRAILGAAVNAIKELQNEIYRLQNLTTMQGTLITSLEERLQG